MSKIYAKMPDECTARVQRLLKRYYTDLVEAGVTIDLLSVATDGEGAPLKLHGYPCAAVVRVVSAKDRAKGHGDAEIVFDEERYHVLNDAERNALIDHELYHIELRIAEESEDDDGNVIPEHVMLDAQMRPKLSLRKHDVQIGHFVEIAQRHGAASQECKQATQIYLEHEQSLFAFVGEGRKLALEEGPSAKVREIASDIMNASPAVRDAARNLVANLRKDGVTMTMKSGGHETTVA